MRRNISWICLAGGALILALPGCSPTPVFDRLPTELGGLPADAPARPQTRAPFPAVHDVPERSTTPLTDAEQLRLEQDLAETRKRQGRLQDPSVKTRGDAANAASTAAMQKAKAAAQDGADTGAKARAKDAAKKKPSAPNPR
jgi:hypothetical protein